MPPAATAPPTRGGSGEPSSYTRSGARRDVYVWLAAVVERIVRDVLRDVLLEISGTSVPNKEVAPNLFALLCDSELAAIADRNRQNSWDVRIAMFRRLLSSDHAAFSVETLPIDARTIVAEHFDTIWMVFGISGPSLPTPRHRAALRELAEGRNDVAHGHIDPVMFGKAKATQDMHNLVDRVDDVLLHLIVAMDEYMSTSRYRRV